MNVWKKYSNLITEIRARIMRARILKTNLQRISFRTGLLLFFAAWGMAFGVRTAVCNRDIKAAAQLTGADLVPFLVESSIMYHYVHEVAAGRGIPEYDHGLAKMENVRLVEQMPIGLEPFLGWGLRCKNLLTGQNPDVLRDADFVRFQARLWISLTGGFVLLWLLALKVSAPWAFFGAMIYALSPAAVARGTGQDLLCEVFALPFLCAAFAFAAWFLRNPGRFRLAAFGISVFCAVAFWDISQFVFAVWAVWEMFRSFFDAESRQRRGVLFLTFWVVMVLVAVLVPYHRAHGLMMSPLFSVIFPVLCLLNFKLPLKFRRLTALGMLVILGLFWLVSSRNSGFSSNYEHFSELIMAKLRYMNVKPADPAKLSFNARVLWTPALHSADIHQTIYNFPVALWVTSLLAIIALCYAEIRRKLLKPSNFLPLILTLIFFIIFIFMFRFHVLTVLFMSVASGVLFYLCYHATESRWLRILLLCAALLMVVGEGEMLSRLRRSYPGGAMGETADLLHFLRSAGVSKRVFLASMEISPLLKAYADTAIVVQPKFEFPAVRKIFHDYTMAMFSSDQEALNLFCEEHNVEFLVYVRGNAIAPLHIYSYRYMSGIKDLAQSSPAYLMDSKPHLLRNFYEIQFPEQYSNVGNAFRLFRFISRDNQQRAQATAELAAKAMHERDMPLARKLARAAYLLNPNSEYAYIVNYQVFDRIPAASLEDFIVIDREQRQ